ncbi:MAG TPA: ABC transporter ATP-binding protein [Planctomycetota bacterium]|nr:ABC transporter ATP-binding protein [Planctomycetota bacterium]
MTCALLTARDARVKRGRRVVLNGVDLELRAGETLALLGRNGAGKTTFLRAAAGLLPLSAGTVTVAGVDVSRDPIGVRRLAALVPDRPDVPSWMTPRDLCNFLAPFHPAWDPDEARRRLDAFAVPATTRFGALSRGTATRALLAAALAARPRVLLLDEPFAGLDPVAREDVLRTLAAVVGDPSRAVLCATHDLDVAARLADRAVRLDGGRIVATVDLSQEGATSPAVRLRNALEAPCGAGVS